MKRCPFCAEEIQDAAVKCKHCGERLSPRAVTQDDLDMHVTMPGAGAARSNPGAAVQDGSPRYDTLDVSATSERGPTVLGSQYRILKKLGKGGMGVVYLAEDMEMGDRLVAIKVLPPELSDNVRAVENLRCEAMTAINLTHPNIIRLYGFHSDGDMKYLVMEYVDGETLEQKLAGSQDGKLSVDEMLTVIEKIAAALDYAHGRKQPVFHRDLKPSNIMIGKDGEVRLMDFGIAREMKDSYTSVTGKQDTSGTLPYMSPEQLRGKKPSAAMDIYSLGVVCYECLNGKPPFHTGELTYRILHEPPEPLESASSAVNEGLGQALAKDASVRPATARDLVRMLAGEEPRQAQRQQPVTTALTRRLILPSDLVEVPGAEYASLDRLADGSREARERQRQAVAQVGLPLEVKTAKTGVAFRLIPAGTFLMGSPDSEKERHDDETRHEVTLTKPFYCGMFEVTEGQWQGVVGSNPAFKRAGSHAPVEQVSWTDCQAFLTRLCEIEGVHEGTYRLLTEAEWECASRGGTGGRFCCGDDESDPRQYGWYSDNACQKKHPVGRKKSNAFGLYDMHGNVYEWCQDWYGEYMTASVADPLGPSLGDRRIYRGGSFCNHARCCRSSYRLSFKGIPVFRSQYVGLRIARIVSV